MSSARDIIASALIEVGIAVPVSLVNADAILRALDAAGMCVVPQGPTREMWAAGGNAVVSRRDVHHDVIVAAVWRAMVAAAGSGE